MSEHNKNNTFTLKSFQGFHVWNTMDSISENIVHKGSLTNTALGRIKHVLSIAKAYSKTPDGIDYEAQSGVSVDSPYWVSLACNVPEMRAEAFAKLWPGRARKGGIHIPKLEEAITAEVNSLLQLFKSDCFRKSDAEVYDEFVKSINSEDYTFFEIASEGEKVRAFEVARNFKFASIDREKLKAYKRHADAAKAVSDKHYYA